MIRRLSKSEILSEFRQTADSLFLLLESKHLGTNTKMLNTLLGTKKGMTSTYDARRRRVGATIIEVSPNAVTQIKTLDSKDGYTAVQLGYGTKKSVRKPQIGHLKKAGIDSKVRWLREVRTEAVDDLNPGQALRVSDIFSVGDAVKVIGVSKGKGFQGGVRRHGFAGGPKTHGQSDRLRAPGSIGSGTTPGRVYKGKKMAGHMGAQQVSVTNLEVVGLDRKANLLTIKGAVPGPIGGLVMVTKLGQIKGYTPPPEEKVEEEVGSSENSVNQKVGEPESQNPDSSGNSGTESPSEVSENQKEVSDASQEGEK